MTTQPPPERHLASQRNGWWWCAAAAVLFGAATPVLKLLVDGMNAVTLAGLLYLGAALAVAPFAWRAPRPTGSGRQRARLAVAVVFGGGLGPVMLVLALDRTPAGTVSLLLNLEVVATTLIAWAFLREHIGRHVAVGMLLVVLGGGILAGGDATVASGALLVVGACVCWGIDNAITATIDGYSPAQVTFAKGVVAGSVNLAIGLATAGVPSITNVVPAMLVGAIGYGVSITLWITGARLLGAARGQVIFALAPFIGALLAWPVNGETPTANLLVAFAVSLLGVVVVSRGHHSHPHVHPVLEHTHPIDPADPHHAPTTITVLAGDTHVHHELAHAHEHLPDIHHRHIH